MRTTRRTFFLHSAASITLAQTARSIFEAAEAGDIPRATELLNGNPELVRARSAEGLTPIHYAARAGKPEMLFFLQIRGAELSAGPESPLLAAVDHPNHAAASEMSMRLLSNGSDPNARTRDGKTALEIARARGYDDIVELIRQRERVHFGQRFVRNLKGEPVKRDDTAGLPWTIVNEFVSVAHNNFDKVKQMFKDRPELLNTRASWDELAIESACHMGRLDMADFLAAEGAAVSTCSAVLLGQPKLVEATLKSDSKAVAERGPHDIAILAYTAYGKEQARIAEMLLKAGANVHARALGLTALHLAARKGYADLATLLLTNGADVNATAKMGAETITPLDVAVRSKQSSLEELLRARGGRSYN